MIDNFSRFKSFKSQVSMWSVKHVYQNMAYPFFVFFRFFNTKPNTVTIISLISFLIGSFFFHFSLYIIALFFWILSYVLDCTDGALARADNRTSLFGAFFDVSVDRFCSIVFLLLVSNAYDSDLGITYWMATCGAIGIVYNSFISSLRPHYFPWLKGYAKSETSSCFKFFRIIYETLDTGNVYVITCLAFYFDLVFEVFLFYFVLTSALVVYNFILLMRTKNPTDTKKVK